LEDFYKYFFSIKVQGSLEEKRSLLDDTRSICRVLTVIFGVFMYSESNGTVYKSIGVEQLIVKII
jgi:hypothetical protein